MTEQRLRAPARCESCGKRYHVADASRPHACKTCGGEVRVTREDHASFTGNPLTCKVCQAVVPDGSRACTECGAELEPHSPAERAAMLRHETVDALKHASKWITGLGGLYRLGAFAYALATLFAILALARTDVPVGAGVLVVALTTLLSVMMLMGAIHVLFQPLAWTAAIAALASVVSIVHVVGPNPLGIALLGSAAWAAAAWAALFPALRYQTLIAEHKDIYVLHHSNVRTRRSLKDRSAEQRHERLMAVLHGAAMRAWTLSAVAAGALVLASAVGTWVVLSNARPPELSSSLERFETAWNAADFEAVGEMFDERVREPESRRLAGMTEGHGWHESSPRLADGAHRRVQDRVWVDYETDAARVSTSWVLNGERWALVQVELPLPPLEPVLERFRAAWEGSDPQAIGAFFSEENRESLVETIESGARRRDWARYPAVVETRSGGLDKADTVVFFVLAQAELKTRWHLRGDGTWGLHGLEMP